MTFIQNSKNKNYCLKKNPYFVEQTQICLESHLNYRDILLKQSGTCSIMELPFISKIDISSSPAKTITETKILNTILPYFTVLNLSTGQRPCLTRAKKSISSFKIRQGQIVGCKVTLRNKIFLNSFFKYLIVSVLPNVRDFSKKNIYLDLSQNFCHLKSSSSIIRFGMPNSFLCFPHFEDFYDIFHLSTKTGCIIQIHSNSYTPKKLQHNKIISLAFLLSSYQLPFINKLNNK